jgi:hypothetical protein
MYEIGFWYSSPMTSYTNTIERPGADASAPAIEILHANRGDLSPAEQAPQGLRRLAAGFWHSLRQAPAFY